ncbi:MAG: LLM class flavin-dependent oxidoreductase [Deltaproteobacteria bacterium]|nr:LLM class flavin-dependent oxidoreductase [Deltaproteobacteria bacterium]
MPAVNFGVALFCGEKALEGIEFARLVEDLGYHRLWVGDSHMIWREVYVLLGAIALQTKRIQIGPGVTHPELRHSTVTASAIVTLQELSQGRSHLGIGIGATGPGNVGLKPVRLSRLEETIKLIQKITSGETVELNDKPVRCVFAKNNSIPIYVAASSPATRQMAARVADGVMCGGEVTSMDEVVKQLRPAIAAQRGDSGRVKIICWAPCSVSNNSAEAREAVKSMVARVAMVTLGRLHRKGELQNEEEKKAVERLWKEYNMYHHFEPQHSHLVREEWIDRYSIAGNPEQVREKIRAIIRAGVDEIGLVPFGRSKEAMVRLFAEEVMAKV